jgi:methionyl-tRNA formyltransferase
MKIAFFGTPAFAAEFLKGLVADPGLSVVAVVTQPDEPVGRKKILTAPPVKQVAVEHKLPVFQPTKLKDANFQDQLKALGADIGIVVAYGRILPDSLLNVLPLGFINVHPSLLPKYRGPSPIIAALANGDTQTAVTIIKLVQEMDAGPILAQATIEVAANETQASLTSKVVDIGVPLLIESLKAYVSGQLTLHEQDHSQATFCKLLTRQDGVIDWSEPAEAIERKVRAYNPWPGTTSNDLKIFSARVSDRSLPSGEQLVDGKRLLIGTGTTALEVLELQPAGGKRMSAADYLRGRRV